MKRIVIILMVLSLASFWSSCRQPGTGNPGTWSVGNQKVTLADYKGKVVLLDFYATWCAPCREETPHLVRLQNEYGPQGLQVIGINVGGEEDRDQVPAFAQQFSIQYPLGFPDDDLVAKYLGDNSNIPQSFIFDRNGNLVKRFIGYGSKSASELDRIVKTTVESAPQ